MLDVLVVGGIFREILGDRGSGKVELRLAGSALTSAVAASRAGALTGAAAFVGSEDAESADMLFRHASVQPHIVVLDGASGTFAYRDPSSEAPAPLYRPAETGPTALPALPPARVLLVFGVPDYDPTRDPAVASAAASADVLIWDRQGWLSRTRDSKAAGAFGAQRRILLTNADEAIDEGILDAQTGVIELRGYDGVVVKDGVRGALVVEVHAGSRQSIVPAYPVSPRSTVGSGDVFAGVLAARLATGDNLRQSARCAAAATSVVLATGDSFAPVDLPKLASELIAREKGMSDWRWPLN